MATDSGRTGHHYLNGEIDMTWTISISHTNDKTGEQFKAGVQLTDRAVEDSFMDVLGYAFDEMADKVVKELKEKK